MWLALVFACEVEKIGRPEDSVGDSGEETGSDSGEDSAEDSGGDPGEDSADDTAPDDTAPAEPRSVADAEARVYGGEANLDLGRTVRLGDVDGDGLLDVVTGTFQAASQAGGAYVLPGPLSGVADADDVGHRLRGAVVGNGAARSLSVGDLDGDGIDDVGLGAPYGRQSGMWVTFGPVTGDSTLADEGVAALLAPPNSYGGHGSDLGDVDGDGQIDAVVGAYYAATPSGQVFVAHGPLDGDVDLPREADAVLTGESDSVYAGRIVSAGGDLDGDGVGDLVIACLGNLGAPASGGFYVVHGPPPATLDLAEADGRHAGESANDYAGLWLATGDLDGDGLADVVASAMDDTLAETAGAAYVVRGPATGDVSLSAADVIVRGDTAGQYGGGVATGDLDGDGVHELLLGAQGDPERGPTAGAAYLFLDPAPGTWVFGDADVTWLAEGAGDNLGTGLAVGDLSGDGAPDVVIGAPYEATGGSGAGAVYVVGPP